MVLLLATALAAILTPARARTAIPDRAAGMVIVAAPTSIPLPRPRPAIPAAADAKPGYSANGPATPEVSVQPPAPSACRQALTAAIAIAPSLAPVRGPGACGGEDLVRLEAVVLADRRRVAVKPAAILRCGMATAVADWIRNDMAPLAASLGTTVDELDNFDSFECRGRNRVAGAKLSEHGRANALDVRGIKLANGKSLALTDRSVARDLREKVMTSVCARFTTVLGPGSDGYHEDHIHLDLAERRNGYRICHWGVYDPMPVAAPLLPAPRPERAPPREIASEDGGRARDVEQLKVQPTAPPAVSLSPVPLAKQPTDVAKPLPDKPDAAVAAKPDVGRSDVAKPKPNKSDPDRSDSGQAGASTSGSVKSGAVRPDAPRRSVARSQPQVKPALSLDPARKTAEHAAKPKSQRSKSRRARARHRQPELPVLLRRMFE